MTKSKFLLVDLNEKKTKKLANTITSDTSRKILSSLAEKDETEAKLAQELGIPISTVHYHLQKLQEAGLVTVEEFHYSKKGREVNHYKLANKYIIIAPKKVTGLREKLKEILPIGLIALGVSGVVKLVTFFNKPLEVSQKFMVTEQVVPLVQDVARESTTASLVEYAPTALNEPVQYTTFEPSIAFWVFIGALAVVVIYAIYVFIKNRKK